MDDFEIEGVAPEADRLFRALLECGIQDPQVLAHTLERLSAPPVSLHVPSPGRISLMNQVIDSIVPFDKDIAARWLRLNDGSPDPDATSKSLTRAERKRAKRLRDWVLDAGLETAPQGRPADIDGALVVYCTWTIAEASQKPLTFSRPSAGGKPRGLMLGALMAALPLAQSFLMRADGTAGPNPHEISSDAVAGIVATMRSPEFQACCRGLGIGTTAQNVAEHPGRFRLALTLARAQILAKRMDRRKHCQPRRPARKK
jgi:hypothetical protein